ncbi:hypothetical protein F2Q69_00001726 [Brassica cretica]|uniref:Uncharacterized protein n=1 Tax=Brassica cretica TaxID=69181 RepID=A0A8S9PI33_BRACR|nr:hypothetical protein F2Q69_00001726 [Brassica cretica]
MKMRILLVDMNLKSKNQSLNLRMRSQLKETRYQRVQMTLLRMRSMCVKKMRLSCVGTFLPHQHCVGTPPIALCREDDEAELLIIDGFVSLSLCSSSLSLSLSLCSSPSSSCLCSRRRLSLFPSLSCLCVPVVSLCSRRHGVSPCSPGRLCVLRRLFFVFKQ